MTAGTWNWRSKPTNDARLAVGRIVGVKGLRGQLRVEPLSDRPERLEAGALLFVEGEAEPRAVLGRERGGRLPVVSLSGVETPEAAERLVGRYLEVPGEPLPPGAYYWHELIGVRVTDLAGAELGEIVEVFRAGENEVYRVVGPGGETLVPALRSVVRTLDLPNRRMTITIESEEVR